MFDNGNEIYTLILIVCIILVPLLLFGFVQYLHDFNRELRYIQNEINRNRGAERRYWMRRKRRLWLSLIPFVKYHD